MPPRRAVVTLSPLADALVTDPDTRSRLEDTAPERIAPLFAAPDSVGSRTLQLFGLRSAVGPGDMRFEALQVTPRCYLPESTQLVPDEQERIRLLLEGRKAHHRHALIERPLGDVAPPAAGARISCPPSGGLKVESPQPVLAVLLERHHPGWRVENERGLRLDTFPVNQVHLGVIAQGNTSLRLSFVPPGLEPALASSGVAWLLITLGLFWSRRTSLQGPALQSTEAAEESAT